MDLYSRAGKMALGSRLRRLSELITEDAGKIYRMYNIDMNPKWWPVFYFLSIEGEKSITEIANEIGHSHPSVIKIVREMLKKGYVVAKSDKSDGRKNVICLSAKGKKISKDVQVPYTDVRNAVETSFKETKNDIWEAIGEWESLLMKKSLLSRVSEQKRARETKDVKIVPYSSQYRKAFKELNVEWISKYFKMEAADHKSLDHPKKNIIDKGGFIFIAVYKNKPVGTCALIKMDGLKYDYELSKMGVSPRVQGKGIGWLLGNAVIEKARFLGARNVYLESNTMLEPAINLYKKLGFREIKGTPSSYQRCNIQMELIL